MMLCCLLVSVAFLPMFAPLVRRLGISRQSAEATCCATMPAVASATSRSVVWLVAAAVGVLVAGYLLVTLPGTAVAAPVTDAQIWLEALHDAWCLPRGQ